MQSNSKIKYLASITALLISGTAIAESCPRPVIAVLKEQPSPCTGYLFSPDKEKEIRLINEDYKLVTEELEITKKQLELYKSKDNTLEQIIKSEKERSDLWETKANSYAEKYVKERDKSNFDNILYFGLGIATTILVSWSVGQIHK